MSDLLQSSGLAGAGLVAAQAGFGAIASLIVALAAAAMLTVGWRLAVAKRYEAHRRVQTAAVCLNAVPVVAWMIVSFVRYVVPVIPEKLDVGSYTATTVHAVVGIVGVVLGVFIVLRGNELVPAALRFKSYKLFMRTSYVLYMVGTLSGVITYIAIYAGGSQ